MFRTIVATVLLAFVSLPASAQSLVEAAKKAKEERAKGQQWPEPAARMTPVPTPPIAEPPVTPDTTAVKKAPATKSDGAVDTKSEAYWRERLRPLTALLATDRAARVPLEARYEELRDRYNSMKTVFQQQLVAPEMFRMQTEVKAATDRIAADEGAIADLQEEGRKAGALPGWLR